ncbi:MAG: hypothetical protein ABEI80_01270 [Haloplanus sp.]
MSSTIGRLAVAALLTLALVVGAAPVAAQSSEQPAWADALFADLQGMQSRYNANVSDADMTFAQERVYNQLTGNVINVYFVGTDVVFSFYMRPDGTITDFRQSRRDDASLKMLLTRGTAEELAATPNPVPPFVAAVQNGDVIRRDGARTVRGIVIRGEDGHLVKQATWTVINTLKGIF